MIIIIDMYTNCGETLLDGEKIIELELQIEIKSMYIESLSNT